MSSFDTVYLVDRRHAGVTCVMVAPTMAVDWPPGNRATRLPRIAAWLVGRGPRAGPRTRRAGARRSPRCAASGSTSRSPRTSRTSSRPRASSAATACPPSASCPRSWASAARRSPARSRRWRPAGASRSATAWARSCATRTRRPGRPRAPARGSPRRWPPTRARRSRPPARRSSPASPAPPRSTRTTRCGSRCSPTTAAAALRRDVDVRPSPRGRRAARRPRPDHGDLGPGPGGLPALHARLDLLASAIIRGDAAAAATACAGLLDPVD